MDMANTPTLLSRPRLGIVLLRSYLAVAMLFHGVSKLMTGIDPIIGMVTGHGLPAAFAYLVYVGEVLAPLLLLLGVWVLPAALVVAANMLVAVALAHAGQLASLSRSGGWALELQGFYFVCALVVALTAGAGRKG